MSFYWPSLPHRTFFSESAKEARLQQMKAYARYSLKATSRFAIGVSLHLQTLINMRKAVTLCNVSSTLFKPNADFWASLLKFQPIISSAISPLQRFLQRPL
jgi:hypothetical protein